MAALAGSWSLDLNDPAETGRVAALLLGVANIATALVTSGFVVLDRPGEGVTAAAVGCLALGAVCIWQRRRFREWLYVGAVMATMLFIALLLGSWSTAPELGLLWPAALATAFCARRGSAAVVGITAVVVALGLAAHRDGPDAPRMVSDVFVTAAVLLVVRALRELAATALAEVGQREVTDPLTGLVNRRGLEGAVRTVWRMRGLGVPPVSLLVIDLDHFKHINDSLGHAAGDEVLRHTAQLLGQVCRGSDLVVRLGGEEFLVLVQADIAGAHRLAERIRSAIETELAPVTASIGVHAAAPSPQQDPVEALWEAVDLADQALYRAKHQGRNRVSTTGS